MLTTFPMGCATISITINIRLIMKPLSYFLDRIAAASSLGIRVLEHDSSCVRLLLPYQGNTNHHRTMFGGSLSLAATLAGWAITHENVPKVDGNIVIKSSQMRYLAPAPSDVEVVAQLDDMDCQSVREAFERFGRTRVNVVCRLYCDHKEVGHFNGVYVAIKPSDIHQ